MTFSNFVTFDTRKHIILEDPLQKYFRLPLEYESYDIGENMIDIFVLGWAAFTTSQLLSQARRCVSCVWG
jgi:hypothetical protein